MIASNGMMQAELFILRLSRSSGVLGLAGMAFTSEMFPEFPNFSRDRSKAHGILLVRPLLEFSKEDMYDICRGGNQQWVEDPTNRSPIYARNRIRMSLSNLSSPMFKAELHAAISECRRTRLHVDRLCHLLLNEIVSIMPHGYAVINIETLQSMQVKDIYLAKFAALVLQFISQRHRPVRGNASKLLLNYLKTFPCKTCLTVAGCYLCPAPGSKGTKVLVCCSIDSSLPILMKLFPAYSYGGQYCFATSKLEQIVKDSEAYLNRSIPDALSVPFLDVTSSESVLLEAKRLGILSESTYRSIVSLQKEESEKFKSKGENISDFVSKEDMRFSGATLSKLIYPGQVGYFMNRFVLDWKACNRVTYNALPMNESVPVKELDSEGQCCCSSYLIGDEMVAEVRPMIDADWVYLSDLSKKTLGDQSQNHPAVKTERLTGRAMDYAILSARNALLSLKCIPVAARRAMPVLVHAKGVLLSIPSIGFSCCPHLVVTADFNPRIPLGGGHSSFP
ncbi:tRNA(Ile)-lysidine synthetase [Handroanthus impetiginosus]|uniref:tRNA(Ile)-lysidine synthetase n=1 Tax=Handroanthus impetiginosus TaxID=429701 RepID=A0A2G9GFC1_9LAMI|nr:tRNA(Ile)-lysidine synthetase [Handroanthus impetiginosus]